MEEGVWLRLRPCSPSSAGALGVAPAGQVSGQGLLESQGTCPQVCSAASSAWSRTEEAVLGGNVPVQSKLLEQALSFRIPGCGPSAAHSHGGATPRSRATITGGGTEAERLGPALSQERSSCDQESRQPPGAGQAGAGWPWGAPPQGVSETLREGGSGPWVFRSRTVGRVASYGGRWQKPIYQVPACPVHLSAPSQSLHFGRQGRSWPPAVPHYAARVEQAPVHRRCRRSQKLFRELRKENSLGRLGSER